MSSPSSEPLRRERHRHTQFNSRALLSWAGFFTLVRMPLAVVFPFLLVRDTSSALIVYLVGIVTDVVDGVIARRTGMTSLAGALADGAADKTFHLVVAISLVTVGLMPSWWLLLWFLREIGQLTLLAILLLLGRFDPLHHRGANRLGKLATITLSLAIIGTLLEAQWLAAGATWATAVLGLASVVVYAHLERS